MSKIKKDFEEFSDSESEQGYILTRCMFDVLLNLAVTAEKSQVVVCAQLATKRWR